MELKSTSSTLINCNIHVEFALYKDLHPLGTPKYEHFSCPSPQKDLRK